MAAIDGELEVIQAVGVLGAGDGVVNPEPGAGGVGDIEGDDGGSSWLRDERRGRGFERSHGGRA